MTDLTETLDFLYGLLEEKKKSSKTKRPERRIVHRVQGEIHGIRKNSVNQQTSVLALLEKYAEKQEVEPHAFLEMVVLPPLVKYKLSIDAQSDQSPPPSKRPNRII